MKGYALLRQWIDEAEEIALVCHRSPDGDTVGSALALYAALHGVGKQVTVCCDDPLPKDLSALPNADIFGVQSPKTDFDLTIAVDIADPALAGDSYRYVESAKHSVCIDHHATHAKVAELDITFVCAANTQNVFDFLSAYYPQALDLDVATCIYTGLVTDSGGFSYSSVTQHTHDVAGKCLALGVDGAKICYEQLAKTPLNVLRMRAEAYHHAVFDYGGKVGVVVFSLDMLSRYGCSQEDLAGSLVDMMKADSVVIGISLAEAQPGRYRVSVRSKGEYSAAEVCETFGGGGHRNAAGCRLNGQEGIVIDMLLEAAGKQL